MKIIAGFILFCWLFIVLFYNFFGTSPEYIQLDMILKKPSAQQWLGYDEVGRSVLDRLLEGARTSLVIALSVASLSLFIGTFIGLVAAWFGGICDRIISIIIDSFMAFPGLLLAIALAGMLGPGVSNVIIALVITGWVSFARLVRVQALSVKEREHITAAYALGQKPLIINLKHIVPFILAPLLIQFSFEMGAAVLAEATLSFLGLGVQAPAASWGQMIREGVRYMLVAPHLVLFPGLCLFLVIFSINILGDQLRDYMGPHITPRQN